MVSSPAPQPQSTEFQTTDYPLVAGFGLNEAEQLLVEYWLGAAGDQLRRWPAGEIQPGRLHRGLNYYPISLESDRRELLQCYRPLLVLAGRDSDRKHVRDQLFQAGIAACWTVPAPGEPIIFPALPRPRRAGPVFLIEDDPVYRSLFRQMLYFAGYDVRADQHSLEILETPDALADLASPMPALILASLDTARMDIPAFFHRLATFLKKHPGRGPRVMLTKDFGRPGLDVRTIEHAVRPHAARIFHPREAILALIEALFLSPHDTDAAVGFAGMSDRTRAARGESNIGSTAAFASSLPTARTLDELLYRPHIKLRETAPGLESQFENLQVYRRIQPFLWMYDCLAEHDGRGAILNDPGRT